MVSPQQFADSLHELSKRIVDNVDAGWRATVLAVDQAVVVATPVDTGRARSNWRVSTDKTEDIFEAFAKGVSGSTASANTQAALDQGAEAVKQATGDVMYISNNLPYIQPLNDGSSAQAPAGFVEQAVQAGIDAVAQIKALG